MGSAAGAVRDAAQPPQSATQAPGPLGAPTAPFAPAAPFAQPIAA